MKSRRLIQNIDVKLSIGGIGAGLILLAYASVQGIIFLQEIALTLAIASGVYLLLKRTKLGKDTENASLSALAEKRQISNPIRKLYLLDILFFGLCAVGTVLLAQHGWEHYAFLAIVATMAAILAIEIFLNDNRAYSFFIVGKLLVLGMLIRANAYYYYPSVLGGDPWYFTDFVEQLIQQGNTQGLGNYESFPIMPIIGAAISEITSLTPRDSLFVVGSLTVVSLTFIFLVTRKLFDERVALLSVLLLVILSQHILFGYYITAMGLGVALLPLILLLLLKKGGKFVVCLILVLVATIFTHSIFSAVVLAFFIIAYIGYSVYQRLWRSRETAGGFPSIALVTLYFVMLMSYWMHLSDWWKRIGQAVFRVGSSLPGMEAVLSASSESVGGRIIQELPGLLFVFFAIMGTLYVLGYQQKKESNSTVPFILSALGFTLVVVLLTNLVKGSGSHRWLVFMMILLSTPSAVGLLVLSSTKNSMRTICIQSALVILLAGLMLMNHSTNINENVNPWMRYPRQALTSSEMQAAETLHRRTDELISTDWYYKHIFKFKLHSDRIEDADPILLGEKQAQGIIVVREEVRDNPSSYPIGGTVSELDESPYDSFLNQEQHNLIYDCGSVKAVKVYGSHEK